MGIDLVVTKFRYEELCK